MRLSGISGGVVIMEKQIYPGKNRISLNDFGQIPAGFYFVEIESERQREIVRWVKM